MEARCSRRRASIVVAGVWVAVLTAVLGPGSVAFAQVVDVVAGHDETLFVDARGQVYETSHLAAPMRVWWLSRVTAVSAGRFHSLAVRTDGTVAAWGINGQGELGQTTDGTWGRVERVPLPDGVVATAVAAGYGFSLALTNEGHVYAWGDNEYGQLGDGTTEGRPIPSRVVGIEDAVAIAAGQRHALALLRHGTVLAWGRNDRGQLGNGEYEGFETLPGSVEFGFEVRIGLLGGQPAIVRTIASHASADHSAAILEDGVVVTWGANGFAQLGTGTLANTAWAEQVPGITNAVAVAVGASNTYALLANGSVYAWSNNEFGQLGDGTLRHRPGPTEVAGVRRATKVTAGYSFALALFDDGRVVAWGRNDDGALGTGDSVDRVVPEYVEGAWIY